MTPKQERFVQEYLLDLNAAAAARRAGYSERSAESIGHENLRKPEIAAAIEAARAARAQSSEVRADQVLRELARVAFSDLRRCVSWGPDGVRLLPSAEIDLDAAATVAEVAQVRGGLKIKLHSKMDALRQLAQHLGLLKDQVDVNVKGAVNVRHQLDLSNLTNDQLDQLDGLLAAVGLATAD